MPVGPLQSLIGLSVEELYLVYVAIAQADHRHRLRAFYGDQPPPKGHAELRALKYSQFAERFELAQTMVGGEAIFLGRLSRQACAYQIDIPAELARRRQAA